MALSLPNNQYVLLRFLSEKEKPALLLEIAEGTGVDQSLIAAAAQEMESQGFVKVEEEPYDELTLQEAGRPFVESGEELPEFRIQRILAEKGPLPLPEVAKHLSADPTEIGKSVRFIFSKGLARKDKKTGVLVPNEGKAPAPQTFDDVVLLGRFKKSEDGTVRLVRDDRKRFARAVSELKARDFLKVHSRVRRRLLLTSQGEKRVREGLKEKQEKNQLEPEMLADGSWREVTFRPYNVAAEAAPAYPAKPHPLRRILEEARRAFHYLGFAEIHGPYVESAFWDFDALFQPQDHPAREMQDTFYVARPGRFSLPEREIVERIRAAHENGGDTGSLGWGYKWSEEEARRVVLRTHTTAATVYALREDPNPPRKVFLIGRVFRREKTDYKHLPEFHQVDGIIVDERASLSALLGTLAEFYRHMGFDNVKFRPSFFPYTEPSVEVFARMEGRGDWFELGGAGVFRPEVTRPFGCEVPVLAWGLGLERLAMKRYDLTDIRKLYWSDIRWLEESPLCL